MIGANVITSADRQGLPGGSPAALWIVGGERSPWLLVHTKTKQETVAEQGLTTRGFPTYCPHVLEPPAHARAPGGPLPLFPSYVFWKADVERGRSSSERVRLLTERGL
jgi:hypothetical protein